jgi:hypothetical protein
VFSGLELQIENAREFPRQESSFRLSKELLKGQYERKKERRSGKKERSEGIPVRGRGDL